MSSAEERKSKFLQMIGITLFLILMLLIFMRDNPKGKANQASHSVSVMSNEKSEEHAQNVSLHLQDFEKRLQVERDRAQMENLRVAPAPRLGDKVDKGFPREYGVNLVQENDTILDDINRNKEAATPKIGPREFIYNELSNRSSDENEAVLEGLDLKNGEAKYIRTVLQRARKDGYELIINKDLIVTGYRKIDPITGRATGETVYLEPPKYGQ